MKKWEEFEALIADLQAQAAPEAVVKHNQRIKGRSGRTRQLDITISQKVGLFPVLIVLECKQYKRPVSIDKVEAFVTKLRDVGATQGVMVSNTTFDEGAKAIARDNLVTLLSYREAREVDWHSVVGSEAWLKVIVTSTEDIKIALLDSNQNAWPAPSNLLLHDRNGNALGTLIDLYRRVEEGLAICSELGPFECKVTPGSTAYIKTGNELRPIGEILIKGVVKGWEHAVNLNLASGHVLENAATQKAVYNKVASNSIDKEVLLKQPGREITQEEFEAYKNKSAFASVQLNLNKVKRYLRLEITKKQ